MRLLTHSYFGRSLLLPGELKTPLLLMYPPDVIFEGAEGELPEVELDVRVFSVADNREYGGRVLLNLEEIPPVHTIEARRSAYHKGRPLEGGLFYEGVEVEMLLVPPFIPPPRGHFTTIPPSALQARREGKLLYYPHGATPLNTSLLLYSGVDVVDNLAVIRESLEGILYTTGMKAPVGGEDLRSCVESNTAELLRSLKSSYYQMVHGDLRMAAEVDGAKGVENALWLKHLDEIWGDEYRRRAPMVDLRPWEFASREAFLRPQVRRWVKRLKERYRPPDGKDYLLLLPCSSTKPYSFSPTHRLMLTYFRRIEGFTRVHQVILTSPLGVVPRELEEIWPAQAYDIPVTGRWYEEEVARIRDLLLDLIAKGRYRRIFWLHPSRELYDALRDLEDFDVLFRERWSYGKETLERAAEILKSEISGVGELKDVGVEEEVSALRFEMGSGAEAMLASARVVKERDRRVLAGEEGALAYLLYGRGKHYLTLKGGRRLWKVVGDGGPVVAIDDFYPKGKVFLQGILSANDDIEVGDEVIIVYDGEVRAVGEALMAGEELKGGKYTGAGVKVREAIEG